jgi:hypothetical protein
MKTLRVILFAVFVALSPSLVTAADEHQPPPRVDDDRVRRPPSSSATVQTSTGATDNPTKRQPLQRQQQQKYGRAVVPQSTDDSRTEKPPAQSDRRLDAAKKGDAGDVAGRQIVGRVGDSSTAALKAPSIGSITAKASNRTQQQLPIVVAISVQSRRLQNKVNGEYITLYVYTLSAIRIY